MRTQLVVGVLALLAAGPASAQDFKLHVDLFGQKKTAPKAPAIDWSRGAAAARVSAEPIVVCGMTVVPADPTIDPRMRVAPATGTAFTMKVVPPTVCTAR
jgi:hypothetical protein